MEITGKAAVIGDNDAVLAFKALGLDVYIVENADYARDMVRRLSNAGYIVIFVGEKIAASLADNRYKSKPYPIIIPIPDGYGRIGYGEQLLKSNIKKAIGTDIKI